MRLWTQGNVRPPVQQRLTAREFTDKSSAPAPLSLPLCQSDHAYNAGAWVYNASITTYPYSTGDDEDWAPQCTALQREYKATGQIPAFLQYTWQPHACTAATLDRKELCRMLGNRTIGMIGDSINQQFARAILGRMRGYFDDMDEYSRNQMDVVQAPLCGEGGAHFNFHRWNKYEPNDESREKLVEVVNSSDIMIFNFGVHYMPWLEYEAAMVDLIQLLEEHAAESSKNKKFFWRSTIASHANCSDATAPETSLPSLHADYGADEIILQDSEIAQPRLLQSSLDLSILHVDQTTLLRRDGHRVIGHNGASDCLHYCEPGPIDSWVDLFYHHMVLMEKGLEWSSSTAGSSGQ